MTFVVARFPFSSDVLSFCFDVAFVLPSCCALVTFLRISSCDLAACLLIPWFLFCRCVVAGWPRGRGPPSASHGRVRVRHVWFRLFVCVRAWVRTCVRACVCVAGRVCVCVCVCALVACSLLSSGFLIVVLARFFAFACRLRAAHLPVASHVRARVRMRAHRAVI